MTGLLPRASDFVIGLRRVNATGSLMLAWCVGYAGGCCSCADRVALAAWIEGFTDRLHDGRTVKQEL